MFEARASHILEIEISEIEVERGTSVLAGERDAGDAFVISGERDGDTSSAVEGKRVMPSVNPKNDVIRGEIDLDHDVTGGHLL